MVKIRIRLVVDDSRAGSRAVEAMEQRLAMGQEDGMTQAVGQILSADPRRGSVHN
jgi:hypothetical protein